MRRYARACHLASVHAGGLLEPLYRLHATRLKVLRTPDAPLADLTKCGHVCRRWLFTRLVERQCVCAECTSSTGQSCSCGT